MLAGKVKLTYVIVFTFVSPSPVFLKICRAKRGHLSEIRDITKSTNLLYDNSCYIFANIYS